VIFLNQFSLFSVFSPFFPFLLQSLVPKLLRGVHIYEVFPPSLSLPLALFDQMPYSLGDRVIIVANDRPVPFGEQGTVVTIVGEFLDIILDNVWIGADNLGGR
jgi:hypothetical protein